MPLITAAIATNGQPVCASSAGGHGTALATLRGSCFASQWVGVSRMLLEWNAASLPCSFGCASLTVSPPTTYVLCVRSRGRRYKMWEDVGEVMVFSLYNGETLYDDAVFEAWSVVGHASGNIVDKVLRLYAASFVDHSIYAQYSIQATFPGRVQLAIIPIHTVGGPPNPVLRFSNTSPLCP